MPNSPTDSFPSSPEHSSATPDPDQPNVKLQEAHDDFERAYSKIRSTTRRRKPSYAFIEEAERYSIQLRQQMLAAAEKDISSHDNNEPCLEKFQLLPNVVQSLQRKDMEELMLDNGILDAMRLWLEPFDDGTLPSVDLKLTLLDLLATMDIDTDHLRESGIGRVIMFMYKCPREIPEVKRKSGALISKWCKPILRTSALREGANDGRMTKKLVVSEPKKGQKIDLSYPHASIPKPALFDYPVRPVSKINVTAIKEQAKDTKEGFAELSGRIKKASQSSSTSKTSLAGKMQKPNIEGKGLL